MARTPRHTRLETPFFAQSIPAQEVRRIAQLAKNMTSRFAGMDFSPRFEVNATKNMLFIVSDGRTVFEPVKPPIKSALRQST